MIDPVSVKYIGGLQCHDQRIEYDVAEMVGLAIADQV